MLDRRILVYVKGQRGSAMRYVFRLGALISSCFLFGGCCAFSGEVFDYRPRDTSHGFELLIRDAGRRAGKVPSPPYDFDVLLRDEIFETVDKKNPIAHLKNLGANCRKKYCIYAGVRAVSYNLYNKDADGAVYVQTCVVSFPLIPVQTASDVHVFCSNRGHFRDSVASSHGKFMS